MEFKSSKGIYLQIAERLCHKILARDLLAGDRVVSVRELAMEIEVNRNTVMRAYSFLQKEAIFENKRGVGFFVAEGALEIIKEKEKKVFFEVEIPHLLRKIRLLKLNSQDLESIILEIKQHD